jgi:alpha-mannosidase
MPVLFPVGDDHVKLAVWLPEAAQAVRARHPEMEVALGGYHHHLPKMGTVEHTVRGELRSPAFAPVLAGVASARMREKQMAYRAAVLLKRYAEPLWALARQAGALGSSAGELIERAWRQLLLNHAHDSVAGCGADESHEDVKARFRWAEQLAQAARDQALAQLRIELPADAPAWMLAFQAGPAGQVTVEVNLPRALGGEPVAIGPDGSARPIQLLGGGDLPPLFEGEFPASEIAQYMGGLDPATPLFGKYLSGIAAREESPGCIRLDVGLGEHPPPAGSLEADQKRLQQLMTTAQKFHIVMHAGSLSRPALVQAGGAAQGAVVAIAVRPGAHPEDFERAGKLDGELPGIHAGPLRVLAQPDGSVLISDERVSMGPVRANELVDEGDRGDLYHFDEAGTKVTVQSARSRVTEAGPLRSRLIVEQELALPIGLTADRSSRAHATRTCVATTEISVTAGDRKVEFKTTFDNQVCDHRLRALVHAPIHAQRLDVEHGLAVVARPLDPTAALGAGSERAAPTGQHHGFVDVSDGNAGVALMSRGLPEHEVVRERSEHGDRTQLALTLVRSVGWLSRGDLKVIDHAAGPMLATPAAQEQGLHTFEYAIVLHAGDWQEGKVLIEAGRYHAPPLAIQAPKGRASIPPNKPLVDVGPSTVTVSAVHPAQGGRGLIVRLLNASGQRVEAALTTLFGFAEALEVNPLEQPIDSSRRCKVSRESEHRVKLSLGAWQLATILLR